MGEDDFDRQRRAMVTNQLRPGAVNDPVVLAAMAEMPRERFVAPGEQALAYADKIVPLAGGRALNPPAVAGRMLTAAAPRAGDRALVVGAGTGYVAALLAAIGCAVVALETSAELAGIARRMLAATPSVEIVEGPLANGWAAKAPYSLIVIDGAVEHVPEAIVAQLADGGRLVGAILDRGVSRLVSGRRQGAGFGVAAFADADAAPLPGFAPAPAFAF